MSTRFARGDIVIDRIVELEVPFADALTFLPGLQPDVLAEHQSWLVPGALNSEHHTQRGTLIVIVCLVLAVLPAATLWQNRQWSAAIILIVLIAAAFVFSSLTVEVKETELRWFFGPGFWSYRLPLDEIENVAVVR